MPTLNARIEAGALVIDEHIRIKLSQWCKRQKDCQLTMVIGPKRSTRTNSQNANYWANLERAGRAAPFYCSAKELHDTLGYLFRADLSMKIPRIESTADMDRARFAKYIDEQVIPWLAEQGWDGWMFDEEHANDTEEICPRCGDPQEGGTVCPACRRELTA